VKRPSFDFAEASELYWEIYNRHKIERGRNEHASHDYALQAVFGYMSDGVTLPDDETLGRIASQCAYNADQPWGKRRLSEIGAAIRAKLTGVSS